MVELAQLGPGRTAESRGIPFEWQREPVPISLTTGFRSNLAPTWLASGG